MGIPDLVEKQAKAVQLDTPVTVGLPEKPDRQEFLELPEQLEKQDLVAIQDRVAIRDQVVVLV